MQVNRIYAGGSRPPYPCSYQLHYAGNKIKHKIYPETITEYLNFFAWNFLIETFNIATVSFCFIQEALTIVWVLYRVETWEVVLCLWHVCLQGGRSLLTSRVKQWLLSQILQTALFLFLTLQLLYSIVELKKFYLPLNFVIS